MSGGASVFGLGEASPATLSGGELAGSAPGSGVGQKPLSCGFESICPSRRGGGAGVEHGRQMEPLQPPGPGSPLPRRAPWWPSVPHSTLAWLPGGRRPGWGPAADALVLWRPATPACSHSGLRVSGPASGLHAGAPDCGELCPTDGRLPDRGELCPTDGRLPDRGEVCLTDGRLPDLGELCPTGGWLPGGGQAGGTWRGLAGRAEAR